MSETKHTPGPWRTGSPAIRCTIEHQHGRGNCDYQLQGFLTNPDHFARYVSTEDGKQIVGSDDWGPILSIEDARLISAAPDLLSACKALLSAELYADAEGVWAIERTDVKGSREAVIAAKSAIAKAEGR